VFDSFAHGSQTTATAWIRFFAPAFSSLDVLGNDSLNVGIAIATDVIPHRLAVISEAVAEQNRVFGLFNPHPNRQQVFRDEMVT